jgi:hypothetical protein
VVRGDMDGVARPGRLSLLEGQARDKDLFVD